MFTYTSTYISYTSRLGEGIHYEIKHSGNHTNQLICQMFANTTGIFLHNLSTNMMLPVSE